MGVTTGCGCKEVYRFPHTTYRYSSCICSFLQQHPYFLFILKNVFHSLYIYIYIYIYISREDFAQQYDKCGERAPIISRHQGWHRTQDPWVRRTRVLPLGQLTTLLYCV